MEEEESTKISVNTIVSVSIILFFLMAMYITSHQAEKIGFYNACKEMDLTMIKLDGERTCVDLDKFNADKQALVGELQRTMTESIREQVGELLEERYINDSINLTEE